MRRTVAVLYFVAATCYAIVVLDATSRLGVVRYLPFAAGVLYGPVATAFVRRNWPSRLRGKGRGSR